MSIKHPVVEVGQYWAYDGKVSVTVLSVGKTDARLIDHDGKLSAMSLDSEGCPICNSWMYQGSATFKPRPKVAIGQRWNARTTNEKHFGIVTQVRRDRAVLMREQDAWADGILYAPKGTIHYMGLGPSGEPNDEDWEIFDVMIVGGEAQREDDELAWIVTAFDSLATAMRTPQGRRLLLVQAVDAAVRNCPVELNREAYRVALVSRLDYTNRKDAVFDPMVAAYFASTIAADCVAGNSDVYNSAIKSHAPPSGPWMARRSAKTRSS